MKIFLSFLLDINSYLLHSPTRRENKKNGDEYHNEEEHQYYLATH